MFYKVFPPSLIGVWNLIMASTPVSCWNPYAYAHDHMNCLVFKFSPSVTIGNNWLTETITIGHFNFQVQFFLSY